MKNIIVREYLDSLTENAELDAIFKILLEVMDFRIVSTAKLTKGLAQYGKDVIAVGIDPIDNIRKRFYFEIKGGKDKDITTTNWASNDGIRESLIEAKDRDYTDSSIPDFNILPIKILVVHNGEIKANVKETFDGFIKREFPKTFKPNKKWSLNDYEFERWDIYKLTELFQEHLFSEYLLADEKAIMAFKRVLVYLNNSQNDYKDFFFLIDILIQNLEENKKNEINRKQKVILESIKLIEFIIISYTKEANNLEYAKRCLPYIVLKTWAWLLKNNKVEDKHYIEIFDKIYRIYLDFLETYFEKLLPFVNYKNGLLFENAGEFEEIGYCLRSHDFMNHFLFFINSKDTNASNEDITLIISIIQHNIDGLSRILLDNQSISIFNIMNFLLKNGKIEEAKWFLKEVISAIQMGYQNGKRLPDGRSNVDSVIRFIATGKKSIYYQTDTSLIFSLLCEYLTILNLEKEYNIFRKFIMELKIKLGIFIPFSDDKINKYLPDTHSSLEFRLFDNFLNEYGYQSEVVLDESFKKFKNKTKKKNEFNESFITDKFYPNLRFLAHIFYKTPIFSNEWRSLLSQKNETY